MFFDLYYLQLVHYMIEIIVLFFLGRQIGRMASRKGLSPKKWILYLVGAWVAAEFAGIVLGSILFGMSNLAGLLLFAIACAFGGYLMVRNRLEQMPDSH
jgi:CDP-diglyceride synthetase